MRILKQLLYRMGMRPKPGSIFFSPSLHLQIALKQIYKK
ncbi:hypothetical protein SEA_ZEINA_67 [Arthrobacter phage Zeina]|nr:hypothetical protein SEA_ZEINA_67 [Arthrobacter phage Zeina]